MHSMRNVSMILWLLAGVTGLTAQVTGLGGPTWGYVFDPPTRSIRLLVGVPGSAYLGPAVFTGADRAWVAPAGGSAVICQDGQMAWISDLRRPEAVALQSPCESFEAGAWAQDSSVFIAWSPQDRQLARWTNFPASPRFSTQELVFPHGEVSSLVAGPEARDIVLAVREQTATSLYALRDGGQPAHLLRSDGPASVAFSESPDAIYIGDSGARQILYVRGLSGTPVVETLYAGEAAAAITSLADLGGGRLGFTSAASKSVMVYDLASRALVADLAVDDVPSQLAPLPGQRVFLLNSRAASDSPLFVLDARQAASVYFIPASAEEQQ